MTHSNVPLTILLSADAAGKLGRDIARVLGKRSFKLVTPNDTGSSDIDIAFVSRDVTGLSTKHEVLPPTKAFYDALLTASDLQWVHIHSAGADRPVYLQLIDRGVKVTTSSGANAPVVAQTAVMGLLALARHLPKLVTAQRERRWAPLLASGLPRELGGQTAVIVGWGPVGQEIGRILEAIGLKVVAVRREPAGALRSALPHADWLVLACPLTSRTRGLIGATELALLPSHSHIVNVARGEVIDEPALVGALSTGCIAGAYLDVFAHEPLPQHSPLWDLPNVIATPHSAGFSDGNEDRVAKMFLERLAEWSHSQPG